MAAAAAVPTHSPPPPQSSSSAKRRDMTSCFTADRKKCRRRFSKFTAVFLSLSIDLPLLIIDDWTQSEMKWRKMCLAIFILYSSFSGSSSICISIDSETSSLSAHFCSGWTHNFILFSKSPALSKKWTLFDNGERLNQTKSACCGLIDKHQNNY